MSVALHVSARTKYVFRVQYSTKLLASAQEVHMLQIQKPGQFYSFYVLMCFKTSWEWDAWDKVNYFWWGRWIDAGYDHVNEGRADTLKSIVQLRGKS